MSKDSFLDDLVEDHKEVKSAESISLRFLRWILISALCIAAGVFSLGLREDWSALFTQPIYLVQNLLIMVMSLVTGFIAIRLSVPGNLKKKSLKKALSIPMISWLLLLGLIVLLSGYSPEKAFKISLFSCSRDIIVIGALPGISLFFLILQGTTLNRSAAGYLSMIAAFGMGAWAVQFTCHNDDPIHILLWHFLPVTLMGLIGIKLAKKFLPKV